MTVSSLKLERIPRQRLTHVVAEAMLERVRGDGLPPGTRLPSERELMRQLHVGRSTVREALNGLALIGAVEIRHGQGVFVSAPKGPEELPSRALDVALARGVTAELTEARLLVEVWMAGLAAQRATPEDLRDIESTLSVYERTLAHDASTVKVGSRFHLRLLEAAHNDVLMGFVRRYTSQLIERDDRGPALEARAHQGDHAYVSHRLLFEATSARDADLARRRMRTHLLQSTAAVDES